MSDENQNKKSPTLEELAARGAELRGKPAWTPSPEFREALAEIDRLEDLPPPPAPDPVVLLPEQGEVLVTQTEAAEAYLGPTTVRTGLSPRIPTGPVKIRSDVDPRRQPTLPSGRIRSEAAQPANEDSSGGAVGAGEVEVELATAATVASAEVAPAHTLSVEQPREAPPSSAPESDAPGSVVSPRSGERDGWRRRGAVVVGAALAALFVALLLRLGSGPRPRSGEGDGASIATTANAVATSAGVATSAPAVTSAPAAAMETSAPLPAAGASGAEPPIVATATGVTPAPPPPAGSGSAKPAPTVDPGPRGSLGGAPHPDVAPSAVPSSASASVATVAPSVVPAASAAPTVTVVVPPAPSASPAPSSKPAPSSAPSFWFPTK